MRYFLLERHRATGDVVVRPVDSSDEALSKLREREGDLHADTEVVLFMAPDEETLRLTHGRYFRGAMEEAERRVG